MKFCILLNIL